MAASLAFTAGLTFLRFLAGFGAAAAPLTLAHLALVAATIAALPAALRRLLAFFGAVPLTLAQRALAPAAIRARAAADMRRLLAGFSGDGEGIMPSEAIESIWLLSISICSLMAMILLSWSVVKSIRFVMCQW